MIEILDKLEPWLVEAFVVSNMSALGLGLTLRQIRVPLGNLRLVVFAAITNFIIVPLVAVGVGQLFGLAATLATGLLVLGLSAGAPFMPKVAGIAKGDVALSAGLVVLLMVGTTMYMPVVLPQVVVGAQVDSLRVARFLVLLMLLPLVGGLMLRARRPVFAGRLRPILDQVSTGFLIAAIVVVMTVNFDAVLRIRDPARSPPRCCSRSLRRWRAGHWGQEASPNGRCSDLLQDSATCPWHSFVTLQNFEDPDVSVMVIVTTFVALLVLVPAASIVGLRTPDT